MPLSPGGWAITISVCSGAQRAISWVLGGMGLNGPEQAANARNHLAYPVLLSSLADVKCLGGYIPILGWGEANWKNSCMHI